MASANPARPAWLRRRLSNPDDDLLTLAVLAAMSLSLWLIWRGTYLPLVDAANVAYTGEVLHDLWGGGRFYAHWHTIRPGALSHLAFYGAYHLLRHALPPLLTIKVLVTVSVLGLPLATYSLLRAMRLSPWLCLPGFAMAFNTNLGMGYLPFVLGIPLIPTALALIEHNRREPRVWRWALLAAVVAVSPLVHLFLAVVLLPTAAVWLALSHRGRPRLVACVVLGLGVGAVVFSKLPNRFLPPFERIFQWVPFSERWDQFDRDVLNWTTDGCPALSFPWLILAFVASLVLTRRTPSPERGAAAARVPVTLLMLFLLYQLGPTYVSWPEPAWGFGTRVGVALAVLLPVAASTAARGWQRVAQQLPWVLFTFWHLCSLMGPFSAFDAATRSLASLTPAIREHSTVLPLIGSEWLKDPERYSFGGFTGFVLRHTAKWAAVESQSYQPYSFCDMGYHPIGCKARLGAPRSPEGAAHLRPDDLGKYEYVVVFANTDRARTHLKSLRLELVKASQDWSVWRP